MPTRKTISQGEKTSGEFRTRQRKHNPQRPQTFKEVAGEHQDQPAIQAPGMLPEVYKRGPKAPRGSVISGGTKPPGGVISLRPRASRRSKLRGQEPGPATLGCNYQQKKTGYKL